MSAVSRRPTRPQPVPWHRMIFGLLLVVAVVTPIAIWILIAKSHATDTSSLRFLFRVWSIFTVFLLIWSAIYIKREPNLVRIVIAVVAFVFVLFATKATFNPGKQSAAQPPVSASTPANTVQPTASTGSRNSSSLQPIDQSPNPAEKVLFQDDFKTGAAWALQDPPASTVADGKLILRADRDIGFNIMHPGQTFGDMSASVNIEILGEKPDATAGMCFWVTSESDTFNVLIAANQTMGVYQWNGSERVYQARWRECPQLKAGLRQANVLKVVTRGNQATININGSDVVTVTGAAPSGGGLVGLRIGAPGTSKAAAAFSDFRVTK